jgi:hypothetical protein
VRGLARQLLSALASKAIDVGHIAFGGAQPRVGFQRLQDFAGNGYQVFVVKE